MYNVYIYCIHTHTNICFNLWNKHQVHKYVTEVRWPFISTSFNSLKLECIKPSWISHNSTYRLWSFSNNFGLQFPQVLTIYKREHNDKWGRIHLHRCCSLWESSVTSYRLNQQRNLMQDWKNLSFAERELVEERKLDLLKNENLIMQKQLVGL